MWDLPFGTPGVWQTVIALVLFGLAFAAIFLRYGLVAAVAANVVVSGFHYALPLVAAEGAFATPALATFVLLLVIPLVIGAIGAFRGPRFAFGPRTAPRHIERISARVRMAKELEIARNVQMSLLPKANPVVPGFDIAGVCIPAQEVGGDYYDFIPLGGGRLGIAIGDVSGKGVPAAIYMTLTKGILQSHAGEAVSPRTVLTKVNGLMYRTIERNSFVSMFYAVLDPAQLTLRFARAGQCPIILTHEAGAPPSFLSPPGMALGLDVGTVFDAVLEERELTLRRGEVLVFYTDGFTEAMNAAGEEFGEERLTASVVRHRDHAGAQLITAVCGDVRLFTGDNPQHDDMTMVAVKVI
jgi:sigma-B regulation protein RsbU (phosphoserine phosphatase)